MTEAKLSCNRRSLAEERLDQRRLAGSVRPDECDFLAAFDDDRRGIEESFVSGSELDAFGLEHDTTRARRLEEVEAERSPPARECLELLRGLKRAPSPGARSA